MKINNKKKKKKKNRDDEVIEKGELNEILSVLNK